MSQPYKRQKTKSSWKKETMNVSPGRCGVLVSCNQARNRRVMGEAIELFQDYIDQHHKKDEEKETVGSSGGDFDKELAAELAELRDQDKKKKSKSFIVRDIDIHGQVFVEWNDESIPKPSEMIPRLCAEAKSTGTLPRDIIKLQPIDYTCETEVVSIAKYAKEMIHGAFGDAQSTPVSDAKEKEKEKQTFAIMFRRRHCSTPRDDVIKCIADLMPSSFDVDLKNPMYYIVVECFRKTCGMSVIPSKDYIDSAKFNLRTLIGGTGDGQ